MGLSKSMINHYIKKLQVKKDKFLANSTPSFCVCIWFCNSAFLKNQNPEILHLFPAPLYNMSVPPSPKIKEEKIFWPWLLAKPFYASTSKEYKPGSTWK